MRKPELRHDMASNKVYVECEKHGRVELDDQTQESLSGLKHNSFAEHLACQCPKCETESESSKKQEKKMAAISAVRKKAGIPRRFLRVRAGGWETTIQQQRQAQSIALGYIGYFEGHVDNGTSMIFAGNPGTGKTHLAIAVLNGIIDQGFTGRYTTGLSLKQEVQNTYQDNTRSRQEAVKAYIDPHLLVLDEVDLMHASEDAQLILWEVLSGRYNDVRPTILISNLNKQQLTDTIGERIIDRMAESGGKFVAFTWESHRRQNNV